MRLSAVMTSGGSLLIPGQIVSQACIFVRNVVITRTLTSADYGIAATFSVSVALLQTTTEIGVSQFVVQAPDGNTSEFQRTAHGIRLLQGLIISAALLLLAPLLAELFSAPQAKWTYALLAVGPILNGVVHLDTIRFQRESNFGPDVIVQAGSQLFSLIAVCLLVPFLHDYNLALAGIVGMPLASALISHLVAERRYRLGVDPVHLRRALTYGLPLLANGVLLACVSQGDRFLLGSAETIHRFVAHDLGSRWASAHFLDKTDLAVYAVAFSLTMVPAQFVSSTVGTMFFAALCRTQNDTVRFRDLCRNVSILLAVFGSALASGLILAGADVTAFIFSEKYRAVAPFIGVVGVMQAMRILRLAPITISLATAHTRLPLIANIARASALIGVLICILYGADLYWIALSGAIAEGLSLSVSWFFARRWARIPIRTFFTTLLLLLTSIVGASALDFATSSRSESTGFLLALFYCAMIPILTWVLSPSIRTTVRYLMSTERQVPRRT